MVFSSKIISNKAQETVRLLKSEAVLTHVCDFSMLQSQALTSLLGIRLIYRKACMTILME